MLFSLKKQVLSFTFGSYKINATHSEIIFTYYIEFKNKKRKTYTDKLYFKNIDKELWEKIPEAILKPTLESLLIMIGINYWCVFPTKNIHIEGFKLTREQANFWNSLYLNGLGEFFYKMKIDFHNLIDFPYDDSFTTQEPIRFELPKRVLLLNGAGKDSILSAEILKELNTPFDFFAFAPTPAHKNIAKLVGAKNIEVTRRRDPKLERKMSWFAVSNDYPSVSTFTFVSILIAEVLGYNSIVFSNERSADFGNLNYLGLEVNHQWCKSSEAENMINDYIKNYITPDISTKSLLRKYSELEIVRRFVNYPKYLRCVTSCNTYFWLSRPEQILRRKAYWCNRCPKCVFLFTCFSAFLPKKEILEIFGSDLYTKKNLLPLFKRILGIEGFKPLDCVGEPEEMILAMHLASLRKEYTGEPAIELFEKYFPSSFDFNKLKENVFDIKNV